MKSTENIYDVKTYTDRELLDILDLNNPSDRELEAKLVHLIRKYDSIQSPSSDVLSKFYRDIYFHFFDVDEKEGIEGEVEGEEGIIDGEEDREREEEVKEGFQQNQNVQQNQDIQQDIISKNSSAIISSKDISFSSPSQPSTVQIGSQVQLTSTLDYAKGKLNPLLKQTYKRTICIDSQYRDSKNSLATDFTLNFTETLRDVVSLKLYAVQIPYTWYTISRNYGSNFIYIKGNSPGINLGDYDFRFTIKPGNYQQTTIVTAIQDSIKTLSSTYTDVSFGNTAFIYNTTACIATFNLDIQLAFNETNYHFYFSDRFYSPVPASSLINPYRKNHLSTFLGFNYPDYSISSIYSSRGITVLESINSNFTFDNSNNTIYLIQYKPILNSFGQIDDYNTRCQIYQTIPIVFPISKGGESQASILSIVNQTLANLQVGSTGNGSTNLIIDSSVQFKNINNKDVNRNLIDNYGNNYFQWDFKLNRYVGSNYPGSKLCLIIPDSNSETNKTFPIWIGPNSCFRFTNTNNELNHIISETYVSTSSFDINGNIYFEFICDLPSYNVDNINNIKSDTILNNSNYSLNEYIKAIDTKFDSMNTTYKTLNNNSDIFIRNYSSATINSVNSNFQMQIDINRVFSNSNFRVQISGGFIDLLRYSTTNINTNVILNDGGSSFSSVFQQSATYTVDATNSLVLTIYSDRLYGGANSIKNGISSDVSFNVYLPYNIYRSAYDLRDAINNTFRNYSDSVGSYPLLLSSISFSLIGNNNISSNLNINVQKQLSQYNYDLYFYDFGAKNTWVTYLGLKDVSYNLAQYTVTGTNYAIINGSTKVETDTIDLTLGGIANKFYLSSSDKGVVGSGDIVFTIPQKIYTRSDLFTTINNLFSLNPITKGSYISYITDPITNLEYTKIVWNINKVYTTNDFNLVFYDLFSFVSCYLGNSSVRNATWDTTLGWILGFRNLTQYSLLSKNTYYDLNLKQNFYLDTLTNTITANNYNVDTSIAYRSVVSLTADTTVSVNLYNYFMVILDDYNQNHLNDGLVTITPKDNSLKLPSYANRALYICDPVTGRRMNSGITDIGNNNLTQNQVYSINQIISAQNTTKSYTNSGVYVKDIFGLIPIKTTGMTPGQIYVELGGTLQNQDRIYFGPVNIHRMAIKLVNDRGDIVDLNGANWSLQFICEQLYQTTSNNSGSSS